MVVKLSYFVKYNKQKKSIEGESPIPVFCNKSICDNHKKCQSHYQRIIDNNTKGITKCPYGFSTYMSSSGNIYTSLLLDEDLYNTKLKRNLESTKEKTNRFDHYKESQLIKIIEEFEKLQDENKVFTYCVHDLKNMGNYFYGITETIKEDYSKLYEEDDNIKALCILYDLINYRVDCIEGIKEQNNKLELKKLHPQIKKIAIFMKFQAKNKNVHITFNGTQEQDVYMSNNIYLAIFLVLENAVKYSPFNSEIFINFSDQKSYSQVEISNRCKKLPEEEIPLITDRGYRGSNASPYGNGLGLALAKEIFDASEADFHIDVTDYDKEHSFFRVTFRLYTYKRKKNKKAD